MRPFPHLLVQKVQLELCGPKRHANNHQAIITDSKGTTITIHTMLIRLIIRKSGNMIAKSVQTDIVTAKDPTFGLEWITKGKFKKTNQSDQEVKCCFARARQEGLL